MTEREKDAKLARQLTSDARVRAMMPPYVALKDWCEAKKWPSLEERRENKDDEVL